MPSQVFLITEILEKIRLETDTKTLLLPKEYVKSGAVRYRNLID